MSATEDRIKILNQREEREFLVKVTDLKENNGEASGTRVEVLIPKK